MTYMILLPTLFFAVILPGTLVLIRETVKHHRQEVIRDLAAVFDVPDNRKGQRLIPSFEFVKFKYFLGSFDNQDGRKPKDFKNSAWFIAIIPYVVIVGALSWFTFTLLFTGKLPDVLAHLQVEKPCAPMPAYPCKFTPLWAYVGCAAFAGAYLTQVRELYRAINNFDLSPAVIVDSTITIATGTTMALVITLLTDVLFVAELTNGSSKADSAIILLAFVVGVLPQAAIRWLVSKGRLRNYKREKQEVYKHFQATPIELIDGIDTSIRDKLADFHISSTQNLAAANPLMLFVETPYGVYQIMDGVAQAQLCASVGPDSVIALWKLGVRTLFDLERAALAPLCQNAKLLEAIGVAMLYTPPPEGGQKPTYDEALVRANIEMRLDDPHVHRLRQIYMQVGERIGPEHVRFLSRDNNKITRTSLLSSKLVFSEPDTIQHAEGGLGIFRVGDTVKILGVANGGKMGIITSVSDTMLKLSGAALETATQQPDIVLMRTNP